MKLEDISLKGNVKYNTKLHPKVWDSKDKLLPDVRKKLVEIGESFVEFLEIDASTVEDYLVVGSIANYNWSKFSDIDLHILMDFEKAGETCSEEITEEWLWAKRSVWMERYDINVVGLKVEVGPQDTNAKLASAAVYSVLENRWIKKPALKEPKIDEKKYDKLLKDTLAKIDKVVKKKATSDEIQELRDTLKDMRMGSLDPKNKAAEYAVGNLVFKTLRNQGVLDKLEALEIDKKSKELSL